MSPNNKTHELLVQKLHVVQDHLAFLFVGGFGYTCEDFLHPLARVSLPIQRLSTVEITGHFNVSLHSERAIEAVNTEEMPDVPQILRMIKQQ